MLIIYKNIKFLELIKLAKQHMEEQEFTYTSIIHSLRVWRSIYNFALSRGIENFSAELAETYLWEKYKLSLAEITSLQSVINPYHRLIIRALRMLIDFSLHGFIAKEMRREKIAWPPGFASLCQGFMDEYTVIRCSEETRRRHELNLCRFVSFLSARNIKSPQAITAEHIYDYFKSLCHLSKSTLSAIRGTITNALRYFHKHGVCAEELIDCVPKIYYYANTKLSKIWSSEEISQTLGTIERTSPIGKRDYAILAIAANLGLRSVDIISLTIDNFDWKNSTINIIQSKTGEPLSLPLSEQIGKAVIDYWQNGRPKTVANELFVQYTLPYGKLTPGTTYHVFNRYFLAAGIPTPSGKKHGLHSLRHSLASRLLEADTPVNVIGNILGHVNSETASQYIRIDVDKLRECALEVPAIG